jgi:hypothetical protein
MEMTPGLPTAAQKFPRYFEGHLVFFAVLQDFYLFIPSFLFRTMAGTLL